MRSALIDLINQKRNGVPIAAKAAPKTGGNVINLMDALKRSLASEKQAAPAAKAKAGKGKKPKKRAEGQREMLLPISGKAASAQRRKRQAGAEEGREAGTRVGSPIEEGRELNRVAVAPEMPWSTPFDEPIALKRRPQACDAAASCRPHHEAAGARAATTALADRRREPDQRSRDRRRLGDVRPDRNVARVERRRQKSLSDARCPTGRNNPLLRSAPDYLSDVLIDVNLVLSWGPMPWTVVMIASAIPQAIRQYSIAVAPD